MALCTNGMVAELLSSGTTTIGSGVALTPSFADAVVANAGNPPMPTIRTSKERK
jgi:hypothetical protein